MANNKKQNGGWVLEDTRYNNTLSFISSNINCVFCPIEWPTFDMEIIIVFQIWLFKNIVSLKYAYVLSLFIIKAQLS